MKTVMILVDQLYLHGGIEKLVALKANYWSKNFGYNVIIVSTEQQHKKPVYTLSEKISVIDLGINYERGISFFHRRNLKKVWLNIKGIKKVLKEFDPDFILVASHIPLTYILPFLRTGAKIIKEFHYSKFARKNSIKERFYNAIESKYDHLVALSPEEKTFNTSPNVCVIPNPVERTEGNLNPSFKKPAKIAAAILRFAPVKQIDKMVEIWKRFHEKNKDWYLYIYGDTAEDYFREIKKIVDDSGLQETIIFKGKTDDVYKALEEVSILLLTSANECFPLVILEAQSCGIPVISFDSPTGPRNIISNGKDGIIVPHNNIDTFVKELHHLANNEQLRLTLSANALHNARKYQLDQVMNIWKHEIFEKH